MGRGDRRHAATPWWPTILVLVVLAAAFASFQYDVGRRLGWTDPPAGPAAIPPPPGLTLPDLVDPSPVAATLPAAVAQPAKVQAALLPFLRGAGGQALGPHLVVAVAGPGGLVFQSGSGAVTPASTMKLLTAAAALESLGPEKTFDTKVVRGATASDIVLVGGGDPYLSRKPPKPGAYPVHSDLGTLAQETAVALATQGVTKVRLGFDDSLFTGPTASPAWPATYMSEGVVAPITALMADQGDLPRTWRLAPDPALTAAEAFAAELKARGIAVAGRPARAAAGGGATLATATSAPVRDLVAEVLATSDNEGAEILAHHVGIAEGQGGSFDGAIRGVTAVLARLGVTLAPDDVIRDGSGLSREDRLNAATLLGVLRLGTDPAHPALREVVNGMPAAGFNGSLSSRFDKAAAEGRGRVRAKTGTLTGVHGLAGVATDLDGNVLSFVLLADQVKLEDTLEARVTLDRLAAALGACHCS